MSYRCVTCGEVHDDLPDLGADRPNIWWSIPAEEREQRIQLTNDTCIVDQENFFTYLDNFESDQIGPFFGWLSTRLSYYPTDTTNLKAMVHFRGKNVRPLIEVEPSNHPLALDQRNGITLGKAWEIVHHTMRIIESN